MLALSRKMGESIIVPSSGLKITILGVTGRRVRLGISGPPEIKIHREEVWRRACEMAEGDPAASMAER